MKFEVLFGTHGKTETDNSSINDNKNPIIIMPRKFDGFGTDDHVHERIYRCYDFYVLLFRDPLLRHTLRNEHNNKYIICSPHISTGS